VTWSTVDSEQVGDISRQKYVVCDVRAASSSVPQNQFISSPSVALVVPSIIHLTFWKRDSNYIGAKMKLAITSLFIGSAAAFSPAASFGVRSSALNMAETATETKVRIAICKCTVVATSRFYDNRINA
jgi:hypothetical protein